MVWFNYPKDYIVCETDYAVPTHLRLRGLCPPTFHGRLHVKTLCGEDAAIDTYIPVERVLCLRCIHEAKTREEG